MTIIYTKHAMLRMEERGITEEEIEIALDKAKIESHHENKIIRDYKTLRVVFTTDGETIKVLTVYHPNKTLERKIDAIPAPHEWWKQDGKQVFIDQAYFLIEKGLSEDEVISHLTDVFRAVCGEFGE